MSTPNNDILPDRSNAISPQLDRFGVRFRAFGLCDRRRIGTPDPVRSLITSEAKFSKWLETAWPGDRFVYHVGHLAADRAPESSQLPLVERNQLVRIARLIMSGVSMGWLTSVQRRRGDGHIEYLAVRITAPRGPSKGAA